MQDKLILSKLNKLEKKSTIMSISQKAIFCYIKPKVLTKEDTLQPKLQRKRFSEASNIFRQKIQREGQLQRWGQQRQVLTRHCQTEKFVDKNYNKQGQLIIIVNRVAKLKEDEEDSKNSLQFHRPASDHWQ